MSPPKQMELGLGCLHHWLLGVTCDHYRVDICTDLFLNPVAETG